MTQGRIWLGKAGNEQLMPQLNRKITERDIEISVSNRTASGRYFEEIKARKKEFTISYGVIKQSDLDILLELYETGEFLSFKIERQDGIIDTYEVKMKPFSRERLKIATRWYYSGVTILLEEV